MVNGLSAQPAHILATRGLLVLRLPASPAGPGEGRGGDAAGASRAMAGLLSFPFPPPSRLIRPERRRDAFYRPRS